MSKLDNDIAEIEKFISDIHFVSASSLASTNRIALRAAYKQFHSLLIWSLIAESQDSKLDSMKLYFREALSDVSHGFMLTLMNLYKPAKISLRSGVENFIRSFLIYRGIDASEISAVYELFDTAKSAFRNDIIIEKNVSSLISDYSDLCKAVHSSKIDYMSLTVPFERLSAFFGSRYNLNMVTLRSVCTSANQLAFLLWNDQLNKVGHENEDYVRDSIPKNVKRAAISRIIT